MFVRLASIVFIFTSGTLLAQSNAAQRLISVYIENGADGFTTSGGGDSSLDLTKSLQGKRKTLRLADSPSAADLIVRVTSRNEVKEPGTVTTLTRKSGDDKRRTATTIPTQTTRKIVHATIKAGDFETDVQGESVIWRAASDLLANEIDHWVKQNYARLIEKRFEANGSKESATNSPAQHEATVDEAAVKDSVSIEPGMTVKQVTDKMGEPARKVNFGQKSLWTYRECQVVLESGKVTDVKF